MNARDMAAASPKSFMVPSASRIDAIKVGNVLRICDVTDVFWAVVREIKETENGEKVYMCAQVSRRQSVKARYGSNLIKVRAENVYDIFTEAHKEYYKMLTPAEPVCKCSHCAVVKSLENKRSNIVLTEMMINVTKRVRKE